MLVPIKKNNFELKEMKSRFIAIVYPFNNLDDFNKIINETKSMYPNAKHYLYAYKTQGKTKSDNNGEPGNITSKFLDLFSMLYIDDILLVVVRYFGGVKLGASKLLRTYISVANECLKSTLKGEKKEMFLYSIKCDYPTFNKIKRLGYVIENVEYFDKINLDIISDVDILLNLKEFKNIEINSKKVNRVKHEQFKK